MRQFLTYFILLLGVSLSAQVTPKQLPAQRTTGTIKIDGSIDEAEWKTAQPAQDFIEWRPTAGKPADSANRTIVYLLYDNTSVYIGGYCFERTKDSISRELIGRDQVGINDFVGVIIDTYNDKVNAVGFYVTPYGEQFDAKYSNSDNEDASWNSVWDSEAKIHNDGWSFEMRIPYSALRFVSKEQQKWGLNITRRRNKTGQQYMWNPIDPQKNGFVNQEGEWTGIGKINSPIRLSFSPYLSAYVNHDKQNDKDWSTSINGGMDVKYGISESFTLDMTLIPDFGQVRSDNKVLNLSPFEVRYEENRAFFTEGTELFNKGGLFYSRRIGDEPLRYNEVEDLRGSAVNVIENPQKSKLINATKISGRTKSGLGIGIFNALTKPMYATIEDASKNQSKIQTDPLTNYNIIVFDQTLKNNSSVSFINTNTWRSGKDYDANVSAGLFNFNNKKNTYNWNGKVAISKLIGDGIQNKNGYSHSLGFGKTGGRFNYQINQELVDKSYNIADMGYFTATNYLDHYLWMGYKWTKPGKWFNQLRINYNLGHSMRFSDGQYQSVFTNINSNAQLKNLWWIGGFVGYNPEGNDFNEPRVGGGRYFTTSKRWNFEGWFESNNAKKYSFGGSVFSSLREMEKGRSFYFNVFHKYRFSDKLSVSQQINYQPFRHSVGFDGVKDGDVIFALRDLKTTENSLSAKYSFNNKSGITLRVRHYWSEVDKRSFYQLNKDGSIAPYLSIYASDDYTYNQFALFAEYTWQFAPGSFINIVWKNENDNDAFMANHDYFENLNRTVSEPHLNNVSVRVLYFLDYLDFKKWKKKK